jgi:hypothetical protein
MWTLEAALRVRRKGHSRTKLSTIDAAGQLAAANPILRAPTKSRAIQPAGTPIGRNPLNKHSEQHHEKT